MNNVLSKSQIIAIKACGKILKEALFEVTKKVEPGVNTKYLDEIAESEIRKRGAIPSFLNYKVEGIGRFPATLCVSVNDEIVHGIPSPKRILKNGDIVSLDIGAKYQGVCTDMAVTLPVGEISKEAKDLIDATLQSLYLGIEMAESGRRIGAIGQAIQEYTENLGYGVVRDLVGHGIGVNPHMDPAIPNYGTKDEGPIIKEGMALAIEPMITMGSYEIAGDYDNWTIVTEDGSLAAHFEHTVVIEDGKGVIVTE